MKEMNNVKTKRLTSGPQKRKAYAKPAVIEEEVFERATLLGASGCTGEVGVCGPPDHPGTIASNLGG
jgi:hypothetical protein